MADNEAPAAPFRLAEILGEAAPDAIEILDVGPTIGGQPRYDALLRQGSCRIIGIEVNPGRIPENWVAFPPGSQVPPHALGDSNPATLHFRLYRGCSTLFEPNADVIDMFESISASSETGNFKVVGGSQCCDGAPRRCR